MRILYWQWLNQIVLINDYLLVYVTFQSCKSFHFQTNISYELDLLQIWLNKFDNEAFSVLFWWDGKIINFLYVKTYINKSLFIPYKIILEGQSTYLNFWESRIVIRWIVNLFHGMGINYLFVILIEILGVCWK